MTVSQVVTKLWIKYLILIILTILLYIFIDAFLPTMTTDIALGQLNNDDYAFTLMSLWTMTYSSFIAYTDACKVLIVLCFLAFIVVDIHKYIKHKKELDYTND